MHLVWNKAAQPARHCDLVAREIVDQRVFQIEPLRAHPQDGFRIAVGNDRVVTNCYSKSVLRVCAQRLYLKYPLVDYFPSYEIAMSGGLSSFVPDQVHVRDAGVGQITDYMLQEYVGK